MGISDVNVETTAEVTDNGTSSLSPDIVKGTAVGKAGTSAVKSVMPGLGACKITPDGRGTKGVAVLSGRSPGVSEEPIALVMAGKVPSDGVVIGSAVVPESGEDPLSLSFGEVISLEVGLASVGTSPTDVTGVWDVVPKTWVLVSVETASEVGSVCVIVVGNEAGGVGDSPVA